jgi:CBS-domain-containing membrane protein
MIGHALLTASDLMSRNVISILEEMSLRAAAEVLFQHEISGAPVVDKKGRCIGVLCATDFMHWAREGRPEMGEAPLPACPFQVKGRLLTGEEAVICTLAEGNCPMQKMRPLTAGRHVALCTYREPPIARDWQRVTRLLPTAAVRNYMTADVVTVEPQTPLPVLVRNMIDAHIHRVVVVDAERKPIGIVSSTDILAAIAYAKLDLATFAQSDSFDTIRLRAYQRWEAAGRSPGDGVGFWLDAERELARGE